MKVIRLFILVLFIGCFLTASLAAALSGDQMVRLKQAGVSYETLALLIQKKTIETVTLTVDEIIDMKTAGMEEETLQIIIKSTSFQNREQNVVYEIGPEGIQVNSVEDLLVLKEAGFSEETIRAIITVAAADKNQQTYNDAQRVLDNIGIWVTPHNRRPRHGHKPSHPSPAE